MEIHWLFWRSVAAKSEKVNISKSPKVKSLRLTCSLTLPGCLKFCQRSCLWPHETQLATSGSACSAKAYGNGQVDRRWVYCGWVGYGEVMPLRCSKIASISSVAHNNLKPVEIYFGELYILYLLELDGFAALGLGYNLQVTSSMVLMVGSWCCSISYHINHLAILDHSPLGMCWCVTTSFEVIPASTSCNRQRIASSRVFFPSRLYNPIQNNLLQIALTRVVEPLQSQLQAVPHYSYL